MGAEPRATDAPDAQSPAVDEVKEAAQTFNTRPQPNSCVSGSMANPWDEDFVFPNDVDNIRKTVLKNRDRDDDCMTDEEEISSTKAEKTRTIEASLKEELNSMDSTNEHLASLYGTSPLRYKTMQQSGQ